MMMNMKKWSALNFCRLAISIAKIKIITPEMIKNTSSRFKFNGMPLGIHTTNCNDFLHFSINYEKRITLKNIKMI